MQWSEARALWWDGLLSCAFFLQHSGMVRRQFRASVYCHIPPRYHRALYSIVSGVTLAAVAVLWQPSSNHLLTLETPFGWVALALAVCACALFLWGASVLGKLDLFGARAIAAHGDVQDPAPVFVVRGPYRWVRHPWCLAAIMLIWSCTDFTADRLLFNVLWTGWVWLGTRLEEVDLVRDFGDVYNDYRRRVPMLIPWHRPGATAGVGRRRYGREPLGRVVVANSKMCQLQGCSWITRNTEVGLGLRPRSPVAPM